MAVSFVAAGAANYGAETGSRAPALPAGLAVGDQLLLCAESVNATLTAPAGWTPLRDAEGPATHVWAWRKTATSSDVTGGSVAMTTSGGSSGFNSTAFILAYRGVTQVPTSAQSAGYGQPGYGLPPNLPTTADVVLSVVSNSQDSSTSETGSNFRLGGGGGGKYLFAADWLPSGSHLAGPVVNGATSQWSAMYLSIGLSGNHAPSAPTPTSPANNATIDRGIVQRFAWTFSDPDAGDSQSKYDLQYRAVNTTPWTTVSGTTPNTFYDFAASTFAAGNYEWQVRTYDSQGTVGPWCSSSFFTAADAPPQPTITAPTSGATVQNTATLTWSAPNQTDYQWRRVKDNAGSADTSTIYQDSGDEVDSTTRSLPNGLTFDTNNRYEHIQVRIKNAGLWSSWADIRVQVSYTPPTTPVVTLTPDNTTATLTVGITNPAPGAGVPAVAYNDVYVDDGDGTGLIRKATNLPTNTAWTYRLPRSGFDYAGHVSVTAVATNGTTATGTA